MIDAFDADFPAPQSQPVRRREPVPAGVCTVEIVNAEHKAVAWRATDKNPSGQCIALRLRPSAEHGYLFCDLPDDRPWLRRYVARAAGIADTFDVEQLIGLQATVEVAHVATRDGDTRAVVRKWLPAPSQRPAPQEHKANNAARPQPQVNRSRNAPPQIGPEDDIPF